MCISNTNKSMTKYVSKQLFVYNSVNSHKFLCNKVIEYKMNNHLDYPQGY